MSPEPQIEKTEGRTMGGAVNIDSSNVKSELKSIATQIDRIMNKLKVQDPKSEWSKLHDISESLNSFFDKSKQQTPNTEASSSREYPLNS